LCTRGREGERREGGVGCPELVEKKE